MKHKIMVVIGTRPEAIKMAPVAHALAQSTGLSPFVCLTGQHRDLVHPILKMFSIRVDHDLEINSTTSAGIGALLGNTIGGMTEIISKVSPSAVLVHGDTLTTLAAAQASYLCKIPLAHVEAGLRSYRLDAPFPEEGVRRMVDQIADICYAPTKGAVANLRKDGVPAERIYLTGNTVVDALCHIRDVIQPSAAVTQMNRFEKWILLTIHRRENFGEPMENVLSAVRQFVSRHPGWGVLFPVHPNPEIRQLVQRELAECPAVQMVEPLNYSDMVHALRDCQFLLTDSGGLQEEAPSFQKYVLILRDVTERPEIVESKMGELVGTEAFKVLRAMSSAASVSELKQLVEPTQHANPFGDGRASTRIAYHLSGWLNEAVTKGTSTPDQSKFSQFVDYTQKSTERSQRSQLQ